MSEARHFPVFDIENKKLCSLPLKVIQDSNPKTSPENNWNPTFQRSSSVHKPSEFHTPGVQHASWSFSVQYLEGNF